MFIESDKFMRIDPVREFLASGKNKKISESPFKDKIPL